MSRTTVNRRPAAAHCRAVRDARPPRPKHDPRPLGPVIDLYLSDLAEAVQEEVHRGR